MQPRPSDSAPDDVHQVLMHPALWPAFVDWLASRGLEARCIGRSSDVDLPSWIVTPTDEGLRDAVA